MRRSGSAHTYDTAGAAAEQLVGQPMSGKGAKGAVAALNYLRGFKGLTAPGGGLKSGV
jgi:hypothetical protein